MVNGTLRNLKMGHLGDFKKMFCCSINQLALILMLTPEYL